MRNSPGRYVKLLLIYDSFGFVLDVFILWKQRTTHHNDTLPTNPFLKYKIVNQRCDLTNPVSSIANPTKHNHAPRGEPCYRTLFSHCQTLKSVFWQKNVFHWIYLIFAQLKADIFHVKPANRPEYETIKKHYDEQALSTFMLWLSFWLTLKARLVNIGELIWGHLY